MKNTIELLDAVKLKARLTSNYQLSKRLEISEQDISSCYKGKKVADEYMSTRIALELGIEPMRVLAEIRAETEKNVKKREFWKGYYKKIGGMATSFAALLFFAVTLIVTPATADAAPMLKVSPPTLCIMLNNGY